MIIQLCSSKFSKILEQKIILDGLHILQWHDTLRPVIYAVCMPPPTSPTHPFPRTEYSPFLWNYFISFSERNESSQTIIRFENMIYSRARIILIPAKGLSLKLVTSILGYTIRNCSSWVSEVTIQLFKKIAKAWMSGHSDYRDVSKNYNDNGAARKKSLSER